MILNDLEINDIHEFLFFNDFAINEKFYNINILIISL
jgi:hypothetical protein